VAAPETTKYWNEVLRRAGMFEEESRSVGAGQNHKTEYWGGSKVAIEAAERLYHRTGQVKPTPTLNKIDNTYTVREPSKPSIDKGL
jgi:hypothetical protein